MANLVRSTFLHELTQRYGILKKLPNSDSLFDVDNGKARLYVRYSKKHARNSTFYGLRKVDLNALEGRCAILCFLWEEQPEPLFVPFSEFEDCPNLIGDPVPLSPQDLWSLKPEDFNKWRQENDLPFLLDFFKNELPHFCDWMKEQSVTDEDFIKAPHTGEWFLGKNVRQFLTYLEKDQPRFVISEQFDPHYSSFASQQSANTLLFEPYKEFEIQESIFRVFVRLFPLGLWRETI